MEQNALCLKYAQNEENENMQSQLVVFLHEERKNASSMYREYVLPPQFFLSINHSKSLNQENITEIDVPISTVQEATTPQPKPIFCIDLSTDQELDMPYPMILSSTPFANKHNRSSSCSQSPCFNLFIDAKGKGEDIQFPSCFIHIGENLNNNFLGESSEEEDQEEKEEMSAIKEQEDKKEGTFKLKNDTFIIEEDKKDGTFIIDKAELDLEEHNAGNYIGFGMDGEIVGAAQNVLLQELPRTQKEIEDGTEIDESVSQYNIYSMPLYPIPEEDSFEDNDDDQIALPTPKHTLSTKQEQILNACVIQ